MPKKRMSEDAKLVIEGARGNLEKKARQSLELMDESEAMISDKTAQLDNSRTQDAAATSGKDRDVGNRAADSQPDPGRSEEVDVGGRAQQTGGASAYGTQRVAGSGAAGYKQPTVEDGDDE